MKTLPVNFKPYLEFIKNNDRLPKNGPDETEKKLWDFGSRIMGVFRGESRLYKFTRYHMKEEIEKIVNESENLKDEWDYVNVYEGTNTCIVCKKRGMYNFPKWNKWGARCRSHMLEGMINVYEKCQEIGCVNIAKYNKEGIATGLYCKEHFKDDMINVTRRLCPRPGCGLVGSFVYSKKDKRRFCGSHKMIGRAHV